MFGLMMRELKIEKKRLLITYIIVFCIELLMLLVRLSMSYGNLRPEIFSGAGEEMEQSLFLLFCYLGGAAGFIAMDESTIRSDYKSGFSRFSISLPISAQRFALAKILNLAGEFMLALGIYLGNTALMATLFHRSYSAQMLHIQLLVAVLLLAYRVFEMFFKFFGKSDRSYEFIRAGYGIGVCALLYGIVFWKMLPIVNAGFDHEEEINRMLEALGQNTLRTVNALSMWTPLMMVTLLGIGWGLLTWQLKRRGTRCGK